MKSFLFLAGILFTTLSFAYEVSPFKPNVVDDTGTLSAESIERINQKIDEVKSQTKAWPAVYVINDLANYSIEEVAEDVFRKWALGKQGKDNGLLILVAIAAREMRIEVGYGLEGELTDFFCKSVIVSKMAPEFRNQNYEGGIIAALEESKLKLKGESKLEELNIPGEPDWSEAITRLKLWLLSIWALPLLIFIPALMAAAIKKPAPYVDMIKNGKIGFWSILMGIRSGKHIFLKLFITVNPGVFIVIFPVVFMEAKTLMTWIFNILWAIMVYAYAKMTFNFARSLFSPEYYLKEKAKDRLLKYQSSRTPGSAYKMFGRTYHTPSRSSSSSSSSSRSSSSGGGRSGGGGASGRW